MIHVHFKDLGQADFGKTWEYQERLFDTSIGIKRKFDLGQTDDIPENHLLFCEHPHVYTLGKSGNPRNLKLSAIQMQAKNAVFFRINRGGDITYHGPGQIVAYPIIDLKQFGLSLKNYVFRLEETVIQTLLEFNISAGRLSGAAGVWVRPDTDDAAKICAIGVRASRYITMHGLALNVNTDLAYFSYINPCGFTDKGVTSIDRETGKSVHIEKVKEILKSRFASVFGMDWVKYD